jgi:hypothetical protein
MNLVFLGTNGKGKISKQIERTRRRGIRRKTLWKNEREKKCVNKETKRENMAVGLEFRI